MKCGTCGQNYQGKVCPFCGSTGDPAGEDFFDSSTEDSYAGEDWKGMKNDLSIKKSSRKNAVIILISILAAVAISAAAILLIPRDGDNSSGIQGLAAPTGVFEPVDQDLYVLTNELLISMEESYGQRELEKYLAAEEGAIVGYFPEMNQFQVRFNTGSLQELDGKKAALQKCEGMIRIDYNLVLPECTVEPGIPDQIPEGKNKIMGILGMMPDAQVPGERVFYLPSFSFPALDDLVPFDETVRKTITVLDPEDRSKLEKERTLVYASDCYLEKTGEVMSSYTTTAALRYQMARLINAGCDIICCLEQDVPRTNDLYLQAESEQVDLLLTVLEKDHPSFLICRSCLENGLFYQTLNRSEKGKNHTLFVAECIDNREAVLDTTETGKQIYWSREGAPEEAIGAYAKSPSEAAMIAAFWAEQNADDMFDIQSKLRTGAPGMGYDDQGTVIPVLDSSYTSGTGTDPIGYRIIRVDVTDAITGEGLADAEVTIALSAGEKRAHVSDGKLTVLTKTDPMEMKAGSNGYQENTMTVSPGQENTVHFRLNWNQETTGMIAGKVQYTGTAPLYARIMNTSTGVQYPDREISKNVQIPMYPGTYQVTILSHDRTPVEIHGVHVTANETEELPDAVLTVPSDIPGKAEGQVIDSMDGAGVDGAELRFYKGLNAEDNGNPLYRIQSDPRGNYSITLPGGAYTVFSSKEGYRTSWRSVYSEDEKTQPNQNCTLTPKAAEGQVRIVLTWGADPDDLDSHLVNQTSGIHVYFPSDQLTHKVDDTVTVILDHDDINEYGPEQTTIMVQQPGTYAFYVHDFTNRESTNSRKMAESEATVTVYVGEGEPQIFHVPEKAGTLWKVFTYKNGIVTPSGEMTYESSAPRVGRE